MADIVGYSRLMAADEDATVRTVTAYREEIELHVRQHRGRLVDFTGDAFLAEFPSALYAVQCGVEIQRVLRAMNAGLSAERQTQFRMGVHLGDVRVEGERLFGTEINIAARLEGLADAGGLFISSKVHEEIHGKLGLDYEDLGKHKVKNLPDPVRVYRVNLEAAPAKTAPGSLRRVALAVGLVGVLGVVAVAGWRWFAGSRDGLGAVAPSEIRSIAVLPLANLSGDPDQEYVADGMTEALIGELAQLRALRVISRTSVMQYKNTPKPIPEIADELNVDAVIEGTVIRENDRIRITIQLIDARNDHHIWNDRYDREMSGVLALQSDVARAVAEQIRLELTPEEQAILTASRTVDPRALDSFLRGCQLSGKGPPWIWAPAAIDEYERAVELDPGFAEAWAALAATRSLLGVLAFDLRSRSEFPKARKAAETALELDGRLGAAHATLGFVRLLYDWDFPGARSAFARAVQLSPNDPSALYGYVVYLTTVEGRREEADALMDRILSIAPLDLAWRRQRITHFYYARRYERGLEELELVRELDPDFVDIDVAGLYFMLGRLEEAYRTNIAIDERCGSPCDWSREARERGLAEGGYEGATRAWLEAAATREGFSPFVIAASYTAIGDKDQAFAWLERGWRNRDPNMINTKIAPHFDPLRSDPRFQNLLRRIGFPES
jgi:TolB-like protein/class 3 adenylate cyclase/tetratricopeptide (TPR) repeat protein